MRDAGRFQNVAIQFLKILGSKQETMDKGQMCGFCRLGTEPNILKICGQFHTQKLDNGKIMAAHHKCMQYSAQLIQYKSTVFGGFKIDKVQKEINRGKHMKCHLCKMQKKRNPNGATAGCAVPTCPRTFHFPCANSDKVVITKRMQVKMKESNLTRVLYRVFCCQTHLDAYTEKHIKEEMKEAVGLDSSEDDVDDDAADDAADDDDADDEEDKDEIEDNEMRAEKKITVPQKHLKKKPQNITKIKMPVEGHGSIKKIHIMNGDSTKTVEFEQKDNNHEFTSIKKPPRGRLPGKKNGTHTKKSRTPKIKIVPPNHPDKMRKRPDPDCPFKILPFPAIRTPDVIKDPEVVHIIDSEDEKVINDQSYQNSEEHEYEEWAEALARRTSEKLTSVSHAPVESDLETTEDFNTSNDNHSFSEKDPDEELSNESSTIIAPTVPTDINGESAIKETYPGICLAISDRKFSDKVEELIKQKIVSHFGIEELVFWQNLPQSSMCSGEAMPLFMKDLSQMILDKRYIGLVELLLDPKKPQTHYHYSLDLYAAFDLKAKKELKQAIYTVVNTNLEKTWEKNNMRLGDLLTVDEDHVMVIVLNSVTDAQYQLRSDILNVTLVKWDSRTQWKARPCITHDNFAKKEFMTLKSKFLEIVGTNYTLRFVPIHWYFLDNEKMSSSLAHKLGDTIRTAAVPEDKADGSEKHVICMGGLDIMVANFKALCHKILKNTIVLGVETIAAIDISTTDGFVTQQDIIPKSFYASVPGTEVSVFSAFNPEIMPISCVLVHIRKTAMEKNKQPDTATNDTGALRELSGINGGEMIEHFRQQLNSRNTHFSFSAMMNNKRNSFAGTSSKSSDLNNSSAVKKPSFIVDGEKASTSGVKPSRKRRRVSNS
ncbi:hypothetical protein ScPMuIL_004498 [Solemya velum]